MESMQKYLKKNITRLITSLFTENKVEIGNANKNNIRCLKLNENFYKVDFNSNELIDKAIKTLNDNLIISKMKAKITECEQRSTMSISQLELENSMVVKKIRNEVFNNFVHIKFHSFLASLKGTHRNESLELEAFSLYNISQGNIYYKARGGELQISATFRLNQYIKQCKCSCFKHT